MPQLIMSRSIVPQGARYKEPFRLACADLQSGVGFAHKPPRASNVNPFGGGNPFSPNSVTNPFSPTVWR